MVQFRKSKSFGPFRITATKRGLSTSVGAGPLRVSRGADGKVRRTIRAPGTGIYDTKVIGGSSKKAVAARPAAKPKPKKKELSPTEMKVSGVMFAVFGVLAIVATIAGSGWFWSVVGAVLLLLSLGAFAPEPTKSTPSTKQKTSPTAVQTTTPLKRGWYPDQEVAGRLRYWNGSDWTSDTRWP